MAIMRSLSMAKKISLRRPTTETPGHRLRHKAWLTTVAAAPASVFANSMRVIATSLLWLHERLSCLN